MGALSDVTDEAAAQERATTGEQAGDEQADPSTATDPVPGPADPFLQQYLTEQYEADSETVNEMLTGLLAVGRLL